MPEIISAAQGGLPIPGMVGSAVPHLQSTLSSQTSSNEHSPIQPHHPITCTSKLYYEEDGTFYCEHATAPPGELRTQQCVTHSVALLIIELAMAL